MHTYTQPAHKNTNMQSHCVTENPGIYMCVCVYIYIYIYIYINITHYMLTYTQPAHKNTHMQSHCVTENPGIYTVFLTGSLAGLYAAGIGVADMPETDCCCCCCCC